MLFIRIEKSVLQDSHRSADSEGSGYLFFGCLLCVFIKIFKLFFKLRAKNVHSVIENNFYIVKLTVYCACKSLDICLRAFKKA